MVLVAVIGVVALIGLIVARSSWPENRPSPDEEKSLRIASATTFERCDATGPSAVAVDLSYRNLDGDAYLYLEVDVIDGITTLGETAFVLQGMEPNRVASAAATVTTRQAINDQAELRCMVSYWSTTP